MGGDQRPHSRRYKARCLTQYRSECRPVSRRGGI
ncbi:unnamed protein product [Ectocarpus sp. CCAP 1310/34]|nr:unnamed protein product [Ectocarpus sp. CCAP 1310/34]